MDCFSPAEICSVSNGRVLKEFRASLEMLHGNSWKHLNSFQTGEMRIGFMCSD